jgi:hypothetical protein
MYFGGSAFASSAFADPGGVSVYVTVNGQRMNFKSLEKPLFYLQDKELI